MGHCFKSLVKMTRKAKLITLLFKIMYKNIQNIRIFKLITLRIYYINKHFYHFSLVKPIRAGCESGVNEINHPNNKNYL